MRVLTEMIGSLVLIAAVLMGIGRIIMLVDDLGKRKDDHVSEPKPSDDSKPS